MAVENILLLEQRARRAVRRAYYGDGLFDLIYGLGMVGGAILAMADRLSLYFMPLLWVITVLPAAKKRWVQPRTGYAAPAHPDRRHRWPLVLLTALLLGLLLGGALAWNGLDLGMPRLVAYGVGFVAAGVLTVWPAALRLLAARLPAQAVAGALGFGVVGIIMALVGAVCFGRYLRQHPPIDEAA